MNKDFEKYRLIDEYLNNKLSPEEVMEFERQLDSDLELQEEVNEQRFANDLIIENRFFNVMDSIKTPVSTSASNSKFRPFAGIFLSAVTVASLVFYFTREKEVTVQAPITSESTDNELVSSKPLAKEAPVTQEDQVVPTEETEIEEEIPTQNTVPTQTENEELSESTPIPGNEDLEDSGTEEKDNTYFLEIPMDEKSSYHFDPDGGEVWPIPVMENKNGELKIFDEKGKEVYRVKITLGYPNQWNGISSANKPLEHGTYIFVLDFGGTNVKHGHVSIGKHKDIIYK